MNNALINLKQAPIIEFSEMESRGLEVQESISQMNIAQIEPTEENRSMMKKMRATLNKELDIFEDQRKMIHGKITEPYNEFKSSYESNIKSVYQNAGNELKGKISEVETRMLSDKETMLSAYFEKHNAHGFIALSNVGLNIILSATDKKLKTQIDVFLAKVDSEVESINAMENSTRILGYYQKTLDLPDSISTVNTDINREKELEEARIAQEKANKERKEKEAIEAQKQAELQAKQAVEKAKRDSELAEERRTQAEKNAAMQQSIEAEKAKKQAENDAKLAQEKQAEALEHKAKLEQEKADREAREAAEKVVYTARFEIKATLSKMKAIKQFFQDNEIEFKGIK